MNFKLAVAILIASFFQSFVLGQTETYSVFKASFSSDKYDEFSPVYYKNGIVFCSNRNLSLSSRSTSQNKGLVKIFYIDPAGNPDWQRAKLFSKDLTTTFNDGPVAFNRWRDTIYFSRNLDVSNKLSDFSNPRNKLGIFYAVSDGKEWTRIRDFRINNEWYNVTTPWLSPEGGKLYFASDKPGGYGGSDLYYSIWKDDYWEDPVNLGPTINTSGNEVYPYINPSGELYFSSDGHPGFGGKDIFFSRFSDMTWQTPVHLDAPINSGYDDFGIITDSLMNVGYFSSNRDNSYDIFHFITNLPQIFYTSIQKENQYCFMLSDSGNIEIDTLVLNYIWDFGDGKEASGLEVSHCFPGPGKYNVKLDIVDKATGNLFFPKLYYILEIRDFEQPYINSYNVSIKGDSLDFDGLKSHLPGYNILTYSWHLGDGTRDQGGRIKHSFNEKGEFLVNLELTLKDDLTGIIRKTGSSKKIVVLDDLQEISSYLAQSSNAKPEFPDIRNYKNAIIEPIYSSEIDFKKDAVFEVEIISSSTKIDINGSNFSKVPKKYIIEEIYNSNTGIYSYIIDQQMTLMATYIAYKELTNAGFKNVRSKITILNDPAARELNNIKKIFGTSTDSYFDSYNRLTSNAYLLLDQIVKIMNKYLAIKLEVAVHTDNSGLREEKLILSQRYAQILVNYIIDRGIDKTRLVAKGFGGAKPIAPNVQQEDKSLNRRIDFIIIKE